MSFSLVKVRAYGHDPEQSGYCCRSATRTMVGQTEHGARYEEHKQMR